MPELTLVPAYGRDYKSKDAVLKDWNDNKDFKIRGIHYNGLAINKADAEREGVASVKIRYNNLQKVMIVKIQS